MVNKENIHVGVSKENMCVTTWLCGNRRKHSKLSNSDFGDEYIPNKY